MNKYFLDAMKNLPEPTEEEKRKHKEEWDRLPEEEKKKQSFIMDILMSYYDFLDKDDLYGAAKCVGKLELIDPDNSPFYSGQVRELGKDYSGALNDYEQVDSESDKYNMTRRHVENILAIMGDYRGLVSFYETEGSCYSDIHKLENRINCLMHMTAEQIEAEKDYINSVPMETVSNMNPDSDDDVHCFFHLCHMFAIMMEVAGEMISECYHMQLLKEQTIQDYENDPDLQQPISIYNRYVFMLSFSRYFRIVRISGREEDSLEVCALAHLHWPDKVKCLTESNFAHQVAQVIANLLNPRMHPLENPYLLIHEMMDCLININPAYLQSVINEFFDEIEKAAKDGDVTAIQYLGFTLADILVRNEDNFHLKERLQKSLEAYSDYDVTQTMQDRRRTLSLSGKGQEALRNAENVYFSVKERYHSTNDASALALMYFRVLEIEYNEKFIHPFLAQINIEELQTLCGKDKKDNELTNDERMSKERWGKDVDLLADLSTGKKTSVEIGSIRVLLDHIREKYGTCGMKLYIAMQEILTPEGQNAYVYGPMISLISRIKVEKYRHPGAHTGFLPFSEAEKARKLVLDNIHLLSLWFKK